MISPSQIVQGMEEVWLIWLVAGAFMLKMLARTLRGWHRPHWGELARGEEGLSYSLSYMLTFPIFFLFACLVVESTWLLLAKVGTVYAAHAGARSAVVWSTAQPASKRNPRIYQSVWTAMAPFVTGDPSWTSLPPVSLIEIGEQSAEYVGVYKAYQGGSNDPIASVPDTALGKRYLTAASRTTCKLPPDPPPAGGDLTITVTYRAPLHIPGAGRILAPNSGLLHEYKIVSSVTLPNEAPANESKTLGIDYKSDTGN